MRLITDDGLEISILDNGQVQEIKYLPNIHSEDVIQLYSKLLTNLMVKGKYFEKEIKTGYNLLQSFDKNKLEIFYNENKNNKEIEKLLSVINFLIK